jgi:hypothetical protein
MVTDEFPYLKEMKEKHFWQKSSPLKKALFFEPINP